MAEPLPIDPLLPEIVRQTLARGACVVTAEPGAGKTTRVPPALLAALPAGEIVVLEPRRIAARLAARRVAEELGEKVGETVGFQVRFEDVSGPRTRLRFVTEGLLARRLLSDPTLRGVRAVILDELHERSVQTDLALALLRRLQQGERRDLLLVAMSATLDAGPVSAFLGDAPILHSTGRRFEVRTEELKLPDDRRLDAQVASAARRLLSETEGDILVFLPGAAEIRWAGEALGPLAAQGEVVLRPLHGSLPPDEQELAVRPDPRRRKLILSTNVAETSVTIDGVTGVVDSGLARVAGHSVWSGLPSLRLAKVSRASAVQRAGRAGRTRPGVCLRLYTKHDLDGRPAFETPEILRSDLAEPLLSLKAAGVWDLAAFGWFERPPADALLAAEALLARLGALEPGGAITELGRSLVRLPLHPRLARFVVEAERRGVGEDAAALAALLGERDIRTGRPRETTGPSDPLELLEAFREAQAARFDPAKLRRYGIDPGGAARVDRASRQLRQTLSRSEAGRRTSSPREFPSTASAGGGKISPSTGSAGGGPGRGVPDFDPDQALQLSLLTAFPDRVARRRRPGAPELLLSQGGA
ncbi:MAG: helicase-related protein, partial [Deltaproteobacteria bacterium]